MARSHERLGPTIGARRLLLVDSPWPGRVVWQRGHLDLIGLKPLASPGWARSPPEAKGHIMKVIDKALAWALMLLLAVPWPVPAQQQPPPPQEQAGPAFTSEQLDQIVAPIALYPDPLLAQIFMASTYPLEIVQAARFAKDNANLKGDQLDQALKNQSWDDSVKSLVTFPQVLTMMDGKLDWTQKLGDAFLAQEKDVMNAVQRLRAKAQAEGNLKSSAEQTVKVEPAPAPAAAPAPSSQQVVVQQAPPTVITIEPTNPQVVYVPTYNPTAVYGAWPYPAYPPYSYYPPGYVAGTALFSFAAGVAVGGALWGNCNWGGGDVNINSNRYNNFTKNVNNTNVAQRRSEMQSNRQNWQHNPEHRQGVQYRDNATQQRYNRGSNQQATQARQEFRGRAEQGRQELSRGGADQFRGGGGERGGGQHGGGQRGGTERAGGAGGGFGGARGGGGGGGGAFQGTGQGRQIQNQSNRGQASRQSMGAQRSGGSRPSGGGGAHGGGGGRGGGGRGGGRR